jgi:hypothetical protein
MVAMKTKLFLLMTIALPLLVAAQGRQNRQVRQARRSTNLNVDIEKVTNCGDLRMTFDRRPAITEESEILLPASQVSTLRAQTENSGMYVT